MCWPEIDIEKGLWTLPAARAKNHHAHTLPLMPLMLNIIQGTPRMASRDTLFGTRGNGYVAWSHGKRLLDERLDGVEAWTIHDIRRTVATKMAKLGIAMPAIERLLNHVSGSFGGVVGVYQLHDFADQKRQALEAWAQHLLSLDTGSVVALRA